MHERTAPGKADLIPLLREDILAAIGKHIPVDSDKVQVRIERGDVVSLLEIDIEISTPRATPPSKTHDRVRSPPNWPKVTLPSAQDPPVRYWHAADERDWAYGVSF